MSDSNRIFTLHSPLAGAVFQAMQGWEAVSRPFDLTVTLASLDKSLPLNAALGQPMTVEAKLQGGGKRYISGVATEMQQVKRQGRWFQYTARLRPAFWLLTLTRDFKIFQHMTALDIIKQVLSEHGILIKVKTGGYFRPREYTVCYGESYFNFVSRLMEEEGISYYFEHAKGSHTMVLCDSMSGFPLMPSHPTIPYYPPDMAAIPDEQHISAHHAVQTVNSGQVATLDFDQKKPKANLNIIQPKPRDHAHNRYEIFNYPGGYRDAGDGDNYARITIESLQAKHEYAEGATNVCGFAAGYRYAMTQCARGDQNREYLTKSTEFNWTDNSYESGAGAQVTVHDIRFIVQPSSEPIRPERLTPYPVAHATDSAIVTGPPGQEIWTDNYGRVKVHFHWDRHGTKDQNSSCWIRNAQPWAGTNFGGIHLPRIGQEVLISYVNNNPDFPVITSRVYNADNMPPWGLPQNATQSGFLTRSTKNGGYDHANAIRFEDKKGEEQLWMRAEKDHLLEVEHDEDQWIGNDRRKTIDRDETNHIKRDRTETVDRDEGITVHGKRTEVVDLNEQITIHKNRTERVDLNEEISIGKNRQEDVGVNETIDIGSNQKITVGSNRTKTVKSSEKTSIGKTKDDTIGKSWTVKVGMMKNEMIGMMENQLVGISKTVTVGMAKILNVGMTYVQNIGQSMTTNVGKTLRIEAGDSIEIVCGETKIKMSKDGAIAITGKNINISAVGDKVEINGKDVFINPPGGKSATTPDPGLGEGEGGKDAPPGGAGAPPGAAGFVAGGPDMGAGMAGGAGLGGLAGVAKAAAGLAGAAGGIPGLGGKAGAVAGVVGGLLGGGKGGGKPGSF